MEDKPVGSQGTELEWCEACEVLVTPENRQQHPNGLGGHVITRWVVESTIGPDWSRWDGVGPE